LVPVAEISDTTVGFDRTTKFALYARAGIQEYWILDLAGRRLIVHRQPEAGRYAGVVAYGESAVAPLAAPDKAMNVGEVLPGTVYCCDASRPGARLRASAFNQNIQKLGELDAT
jgi:Uma2 family endonuclease